MSAGFRFHEEWRVSDWLDIAFALEIASVILKCKSVPSQLSQIVSPPRISWDTSFSVSLWGMWLSQRLAVDESR